MNHAARMALRAAGTMTERYVKQKLGERFGEALREMPGTGVHASLPSSEAAKAFLEGAPNGGVKLFTSTLLRSGLIMPGLLIAGVKPKQAAIAALIASATITGFILIYLSAGAKSPVQLGRGRRLPPRRMLPPRR